MSTLTDERGVDGQQRIDGHAVDMRQGGDVFQLRGSPTSLGKLERGPDDAGGLRSFALRQASCLAGSHQSFGRESDVRRRGHG